MDQVVDQLWRAHRGRLSLNSSASAVPLDGPFDSARGADERPRQGRAAELDDVRAGAAVGTSESSKVGFRATSFQRLTTGHMHRVPEAFQAKTPKLQR